MQFVLYMKWPRLQQWNLWYSFQQTQTPGQFSWSLCWRNNTGSDSVLQLPPTSVPLSSRKSAALLLMRWSYQRDANWIRFAVLGISHFLGRMLCEKQSTLQNRYCFRTKRICLLFKAKTFSLLMSPGPRMTTPQQHYRVVAGEMFLMPCTNNKVTWYKIRVDRKEDGGFYFDCGSKFLIEAKHSGNYTLLTG